MSGGLSNSAQTCKPSLEDWLERDGFYGRAWDMHVAAQRAESSLSRNIDEKIIGLLYWREGRGEKAREYFSRCIAGIAASRKVQAAGRPVPGPLNAGRDGTRKVFWLGPLEAQRSASYAAPVLVWKQYLKDRRPDVEKMRTMIALADALYYQGLPVAPVAGLPNNHEPEEVLTIYLGPNLLSTHPLHSTSDSDLLGSLARITESIADASLHLQLPEGRDECPQRLRQSVRALFALDGVGAELDRLIEVLQGDTLWPLVDPSWRNWVVGNQLVHVDQDRFALGASRHYNLAHVLHNEYALSRENALEELSKTISIDERIFDASLYYLLCRQGRGTIYGVPQTCAVPPEREEQQFAFERASLQWIARRPEILASYPLLAERIRLLP